MYLMRSRYIELGLYIVSIDKNFSCTPQKMSMVGEKKDNETGDPFKILLKEALE
jgi:hypothetical protein